MRSLILSWFRFIFTFPLIVHVWQVWAHLLDKICNCSRQWGENHIRKKSWIITEIWFCWFAKDDHPCSPHANVLHTNMLQSSYIHFMRRLSVQHINSLVPLRISDMFVLKFHIKKNVSSRVPYFEMYPGQIPILPTVFRIFFQPMGKFSLCNVLWVLLILHPHLRKWLPIPGLRGSITPCSCVLWKPTPWIFKTSRQAFYF